MAKNKPIRKLKPIGEAQQCTEEKMRDKFSEAQAVAYGKKEVSTGRVSPQLSCTISQEDKERLNELTLFAISKSGKPLTTSTIIRALIRLGSKRKDELEF